MNPVAPAGVEDARHPPIRRSRSGRVFIDLTIASAKQTRATDRHSWPRVDRVPCRCIQEKSDPEMTGDASRPTGVLVIAVVAALAGVADIFAGLGDIAIGGGFISDLGFGATLDGIMTIAGLVLVLIGVLALVTGFGLWLGRHWAWLIARLWASLCVIIGLVSAGLSLLGDTLTSQIVAAIVAAVVPAIIAAVVLWYLYRPDVRAAFGRT